MRATRLFLAGVLVMGLAIMLAVEPASRLRAWPRSARILLSIGLAGVLNAIIFVAYRAYYVNNTDPFDKADITWYFGGAFLFASGLAVASGLTRRVWLRALSGAAVMFIALYGVFQAQQAGMTQESLLAFVNRNNSSTQSVLWALFVSIVLSFLTFLPEAIGALGRHANKNRLRGMSATASQNAAIFR